MPNVILNPAQLINPHFFPFLKTGKRINVFRGGAGSGKSVFVAQKKVIQAMNDAGRLTLVLRKTGKTHRHSTFQEIKNAYEQFQCGHLFRPRETDMQIDCLNSSRFIFLGLDDAEKLKSIAGVTDIWIEEASEITETDFYQADIRLRGETKFKKDIDITFNPVSALSWLKKAFFDRKEDSVFTDVSTYRDNKFLLAKDPEYAERIERFKEVNPTWYKIYGLGEWGTFGNLVYSNYVIHDFDRRPELFNSFIHGLDWGYNDPAAFVRIGVKDTELYILDEFYAKKLSNHQLMSEIAKIVDRKTVIIADSSEPKTIAEWQDWGWHNVEGAVKGRDSIKFGIDKVRSRKLHIHPSCTNFIKEIGGYCYGLDDKGEATEVPIDYNNHLMDAMRYAAEQLYTEPNIYFLSQKRSVNTFAWN